jgi:uncharacterized protein YkwD
LYKGTSLPFQQKVTFFSRNDIAVNCSLDFKTVTNLLIYLYVIFQKAFIDSGESSALDNSLSGLSLTSNPDVANNAVSSSPQKVQPTQPSVSSSPQKVQPTQPSVPPSEYAEQAVDAHNELRAKHGVEPLTVASDLCALAQTWADYLLESNTTGHSPNDHRSGAGENIAEMQGSSPNLDYEGKST